MKFVLILTLAKLELKRIENVVKISTQTIQECIPVRCILLTFLIPAGGLPAETPQTETPSGQKPWKEHGSRDRDPPEGPWAQAARQEVTS